MNKLAILEPEDFNPQAIEMLGNYFEIIYGLDYTAYGFFSRFKYSLNQDFLKKFPNLEFICTPTTGLTHIDERFCIDHDISIYSLRNCSERMKSIHSTSEFTILMILSLLRNFHQAIDSSSSLKDRMMFRGLDLSSQTIGILGIGRIGRHVYDYLRPFHCEIICWDSDISRLKYVNPQHRASSFKEFLSSCTVLSIHASEQSEKKYILGLSELRHLQHGSFVVNTARASLICKDAICSLIESSHIAGFASDVFWDEYAENLDPQLESLRKRGYNIVMSPHIGGCTLSSMQKTEMFIAEVLLSAFSLS